MADLVLVVAADSRFAQGVERALRAVGVEAVLADQAETAMIALEYEKPTGVILENDLPDRPGLAVVGEMRAREEGRKIPIVLLAGPMIPAQDLTPKAVGQGADACVDVSVDRRSLAEAMRALIKGDAGPFRQLEAGEALVGLGEGPGLGEAPSEEVSHTGPDPSAETASAEEPQVEHPDPRPSLPPARPRSGSLEDLAFGLLLSSLWKERATGVLDLVREKVKKSIWLKDGVAITARSNAMGETLGAVLVKMGKITEEQRLDSIETSQASKRLHGDVLVEMGLVDLKEIQVALTAQTRAKVINCFAWSEGSYAFHPAGEDSIPADSPRMKMSFGALVMAGVKQRYDLPRLRKLLHPLIGQTPRFQPTVGPWILDQLKLDDPERELIEALQGRRSLAEVLAMSELEEAALLRALAAAYLAGVVTFAPEGPVTQQLRIDRERARHQVLPDPRRETPPPPVEPTMAPGEEEGDEESGEETGAILHAEQHYSQGERFLQTGSLVKAHEAFRAAVELYPKEGEYRAAYGWTLFRLGHPDDAEKMAEGEAMVREALKTNPRSDKAHCFLGLIAGLKDDRDAARQHFEKALELEPGNAEAKRELRALGMREEKPEGLSGLFRKK